MASRYETLVEQKRALGLEASALQAKMLVIAQEMDVLAVEEAARLKVEAMSDPERRRLAQALKAKGIVSEAAVGTPGAG